MTRFMRNTPESQGVSSRGIMAFLDAAERELHELHSLMLIRHGVVIAEGWWKPYTPELPHMLYSLSKSFTSSAIGLAVAEGRLTIDDPVVSFFPELLPAEVSPNLAAMKVRHLLAMSTGHTEETVAALDRPIKMEWRKLFLETPVRREPGSLFVYNSGATYMLSAIIQKLTGMRLLDYLKPRLLDPLGIVSATWEVSPEGIDTGGWGLSIRTEDIAAFGQMLLQNGVWNGKQLLPADWVHEATRSQIANSNGTDITLDWQQGYGYQFWRCRYNAFRGDGAFGQFCIVMPDQDAVLAITSGIEEMQPVLDQVWAHLLPAMQPDPLPENPSAHAQVQATLAGLHFDPPVGDHHSSEVAPQISGKTYALAPNLLQFQAVKLEFTASGGTLTIRQGEHDHRVQFGLGAWIAGEVASYPHDGMVQSSGVWTAPDTFSLTLRFPKTPYYYTHGFKFEADRLTLDTQVNVAFGATKFATTGTQLI